MAGAEGVKRAVEIGAYRLAPFFRVDGENRADFAMDTGAGNYGI
jgi:hypothetical protein